MAAVKSSARKRAQSIIETLIGIIFLIPIGLFLMDLTILALANTANDDLAKRAARAAASAIGDKSIGTFTAAKIAADITIERYRKNVGNGNFIKSVELKYMNYNDGKPNIFGSVKPPSDASPGTGNLSIVTCLEVVCPAPFPGFDSSRTFLSRAVEPIVSLPP